MSTAIEFRARNPATGATDSDIYDVAPLRDAFQRFASGTTPKYIDADGTKIADYPYGRRVEIQYSTDSGSTWTTRFAGVTLTPKRTTKDGLPSVAVDVLGYSHLLTRENVIKDYTSTSKSDILEDLITTFTSVNWVAGNVDVQDDTAIDLTARGQTVDQLVDQIASESANENWGVNDDLEFFFEQQDINRAAAITDDDVIDYDLPEDGKRAVNQYVLYYGADGSSSVIVEDREAQQELKDQLAAPRRVVISASDHIPEVTTESRAKAIANQRLGDQSVIQTGTVTLPLGRFDTEAGDVVEVTISDAGLSATDFRVAQIDYEWTEGVVRLTLAENAAGNVEELLIALSDQLTNERLKNADPAATETRFLELQSGVTMSLSATLTTKQHSSNAFVFGQSDFGDTLQGGVSATSTVTIESKKATVATLNLLRDLWQDGNGAFVGQTHAALGTDDTAATRADDSLQSEVGRVELEKFGAGNAAETLEFVATVPAGGFFAEQASLKEFSIVDADSGGTHYARVTFDDVSIDADTRLKLHLEATIDVDDDQQGVITSKGQERLRDLLLGESGHEPTDMVYGTGTTTAVEGDTALGSKQHEDTIDSTEDGSPGVAKVTERITEGDADTTNFSEVGLENASNELLQRIVFEAYGQDSVVETTLGMQATNA